MSQKLSEIRVVRVNQTNYFVVRRKGEDGAEKTFADIRREFERYEQTEAETMLPVAFMDKFEGGSKRVGDILENKEFSREDLPFVI